MSGWHTVSTTGSYVSQKKFGRKVGHVVRVRGLSGQRDVFLAMFDGKVVGRLDSETEARVAVDNHAVRSASMKP